MKNAILFSAAIGWLTLCGCYPPRSAGLPAAKPIDLRSILSEEPAVKSVELWDNSGQKGLVIHTRHYRIYTTLSDPLMARQTPAFLESAFAEFQNQLLQPLRNTEPFVVYLFADRAQWEAFTTAFTGEHAPMYLKIQQGAYAHQGICVAYDIGRRQTFSVLGHEAWHQFNQRLFKYRLPSWLDEGCATLFETCRYERGAFVFEPSRNLLRLGALKYALQTQQMMPLRRLAQMEPGQAMSSADPNAILTFYAQVYALARFLREEGYGRRLMAYRRVLQDAVDGRWALPQDLLVAAADRRIPLTTDWNARVGLALFEQYIGTDLENLEREYLAFCAKISYRIQIQAPEKQPAGQ